MSAIGVFGKKKFIVYAVVIKYYSKCPFLNGFNLDALLFSSDVNKTKFSRPRPRPNEQDQDRCLQDQDHRK